MRLRRRHRTKRHYLGGSLQGTKNNRRKRAVLLVISAALMGIGIYLGLLLLAPARVALPVKSAIDLDTSDDASDTRDRIQIEKINLEVPIYVGGAEVLEKGVWHRYPDRGDPVSGGNFILSAHRFRIAQDPILTKERSPFYNLDKLDIGDSLRIFYQGNWYDYGVTKKYDVKPDAVEIEAPSSEAKLTLYSCTLSGSADGRIVIEAKKK